MGLMASAAEPNIFASSIKATYDANGPSLTVSYVLNAQADKVVMNILKPDGSQLANFPLNGLAKGVNQETVSMTGYAGTNLRLEIVATGTPNTAGQWVIDATQEPKLNLWSKGVYVINDMNSKNFGNMLLAVPGNAPKGVGIHMYDPIFTEVGIYNGGLTFTGNAGPMRFGVSGAKDKILLADWTDGDNSSVWVMNSDNLSENFVPVFKGTRNADGLISNNGVDIAGSCSGVAGIDRGGSIDLYTVDEDIPDANGGLKNIVYYQGVQYGNPWAVAPTAFIGNFGGKLVNVNAGLWPDGMGGLWICQNRWSNSAQYPSILHLDKTNALDYVCDDPSVLGGSTAGAFGLSCDYKTMAVAVNSGKIAILDVNFDPITGVPFLKPRFDVTSPIGDTSTQIAFDVADNFYVSAYKSNKTANTNGVAMYAMPNANNTCTVTMPGSFDMSGIDGITADQEATEVARYNAAGQQIDANTPGMQIIRMSDGSVKRMINVK